MTKPPRYVLKILETLSAAGYEAVLVGGCVRDMLIGRRPNDWDIASSAPPEATLNLFPRTVGTGLKHGTVTVIHGKRGVEVTTFRAEGAYSDHRRPDGVRFTDDLRSDLSRRDFTMNAMAMSADGRLHDPFGGCADLRMGLVRCVGDPDVRFGEDALRMLRAYRFAAQLGFSIESETEAAIAENAVFTVRLSPERVRDELKKTLFSPHPALIGKMIADGLLDSFLTRGRPDLAALDHLPKYARTARLCYELERVGCIMSTDIFLSDLRFDSSTRDTAAAAVKILWSGSRDYKRILRDNGRNAVLAAYPKDRKLRDVLKSGECWQLSDLAVDGGDLIALGYSGKEIGEALAILLDHVIDSPADNNRNSLCKLAARRKYS